MRESSYAFVAVSPNDGVMDSLILPEVSAITMSLFLAEVSQRHPDDAVIMCLDGAGWHRAGELKIPANMRLLLLPPYSPELNPVEDIWDELREKWFENRVFQSLDAVEDRLENALVDLERRHERVQSITGFPWIIGVLKNAT